MADYTPTEWEPKKTELTAARLNNLEAGVADKAQKGDKGNPGPKGADGDDGDDGVGVSDISTNDDGQLVFTMSDGTEHTVDVP